MNNKLDILNTFFDKHFGDEYYKKLNKNLTVCEIRTLSNKRFVVIKTPECDQSKGITKINNEDAIMLNPPTPFIMKELLVPVTAILQRIVFPGSYISLITSSEQDFIKNFVPYMDLLVKNFLKEIKIDINDNWYGRDIITFKRPGIQSKYFSESLSSLEIELRLFSEAVSIKQIEHNNKFNEKFNNLLNEE